MTSPYRPRQVAQMAQEALSRTIFAVSTPPGASNKKHRKVMSVEVRLLRLRSEPVFSLPMTMSWFGGVPVFCWSSLDSDVVAEASDGY